MDGDDFGLCEPETTGRRHENYGELDDPGSNKKAKILDISWMVEIGRPRSGVRHGLVTINDWQQWRAAEDARDFDGVHGDNQRQEAVSKRRAMLQIPTALAI